MSTYISVSELIAQAADRYGDKTIYTDFKDTVSFSVANELSSRIACALIERGLVGRPVLVLSGRNAITPVIYLGVARAGCFYIPVDDSQNCNRINQIIDATKPALIIVQKEAERFIYGTEYTGDVITSEELLMHENDFDLLTRVQDTITTLSPIYVIYTSGSSGRPKGVMTSTGSLINYIEAVNEILKLTPEDVLGNQSPLDYIASIREIYLPLFTGASTVIIPSPLFAMAADLAAAIDDNRISVLCWSASGLELAARIGLHEEIKTKSIRIVLFSGSVISGKVLKQWQTALPEPLFINQYGSTETTASCTYYVVDSMADDDTVLPIGVPYRNYDVFLIDADGRKTPCGETGEICVAGIGVALGYYRDEELTTKSFIPDPRCKEGIVYKTGDYGRINKDGNLEFCGRKDRQIKFMGHRVEPEEIELCAASIAGVESCLLTKEEDNSRLILYYEGKAERKEIVLKLRQYLPPYMVPGKIVKIEELPRLPNGKIDEPALKLSRGKE